MDVPESISGGTDYRYYYYAQFGTLAFVRNQPYILEMFSPPMAGKNYTTYQDNVTYFLHTNLIGSRGRCSE